MQPRWGGGPYAACAWVGGWLLCSRGFDVHPPGCEVGRRACCPPTLQDEEGEEGEEDSEEDSEEGDDDESDEGDAVAARKQKAAKEPADSKEQPQECKQQ